MRIQNVFRVFAGVLLLFVALPSGALAATQSFDVWLKALRSEALAQGVSSKTVALALPDSLAPIPRVLELDRKQPESTSTYDDYLNRVINQARVDRGRERLARHKTLLAKVSEAYGVEAEVIVALWGLETNYGQNTGGYDIVAALATLAYDGRRGEYFRGETLKALKILDEGHINKDRFKGSWAGAMGQTQFMPSSFFNFAEDFDKDGRRDIWTTEADVFASAANYLSKSGWKKGQPWGRRVTLPENVARDLFGLEKSYPLQFWKDLGVKLENGKLIPFEGAYMGSIIQPGGPGTSAFIVYDNYKVIMKWNRSNYFATSVGILSDRLRGDG